MRGGRRVGWASATMRCCSDVGSVCCCFGWSARFWLAFCAVLQFASCMLTYFSPLVWILGPLALVAMTLVFWAIYFKWRRGIVLFVLLTTVLLILDLIPLLSLELRGKSIKQEGIMQLENPRRAAIFGISLAANWFCLGFGTYLLCCDKGDDRDKPKSIFGGGASSDEKMSLVQKAAKQGKAAVEKVSHMKPPKNWV